MSRNKDVEWTITPSATNTLSWEQVNACLLMDLRDELKRLNTLLHCHNFIEIPSILRQVRANTTKPPKKRRRIARRPTTKRRAS